MSKPRISYIDPSTIKDPAMIAEFERCAREGTPRPESQAVRAHVPATFWSFANTWRDVFKNGVADHKIKELSRYGGLLTVRPAPPPSPSTAVPGGGDTAVNKSAPP